MFMIFCEDDDDSVCALAGTQMWIWESGPEVRSREIAGNLGQCREANGYFKTQFHHDTANKNKGLFAFL
jgi:hypothetical protein